ncbi:hypothetical protein PCASD_02550 [Puccinia coronata f. sp. avenae]|uniref:F-box domain-containing protein n=1 Tax=Puccinia coronata f. sp. avenae TaxID=200324 RepID=A0A2N5VBI7_9BASI|nr:hypothetical protein PCASD_02550 [Puccinia coronata f. sp. avenae]
MISRLNQRSLSHSASDQFLSDLACCSTTVSENPDLESSVTRILQRGANAFEAEDYPQAIQYYDKAFQVSSNECKAQRINILDSRAAAKEKNNDLKGSLLDLKQIIDLDPEVPKGYIRVARLFNKMDRFRASIKMFELAIIRLTSSGEKNLALIKTLRAEIQRVCIREQLTRMVALPNFFSGMPLEIFTRILLFLDTATLFCCMAVCLSWRQIILNTPGLWKNLSLNSFYHHKLIAKARYWFQRLKPDQQLRTLSITVSPAWPPSAICDLLAFLAHMLSTRSSAHACLLRSFSFHQAIASHGMDELQKTFGDVIAFSYLNRDSLINLDLHVPAFITCPRTLPSLLANFPFLKALKLQGENYSNLIFDMSSDFLLPFSNPVDDTSSESPRSSTPIDWHANWVCLSETQQARILLNQKLEQLYIRQISFTPSQTVTLAFLQSDSSISESIDPSIYDFCSACVQQHWDSSWRFVQRLPTIKQLGLSDQVYYSSKSLQFMTDFLDMANVPSNWTPQEYADEPFEVEMEDIMPELESLSLAPRSDGDTNLCYHFLAIFGYQFYQLDTLSVAGLQLDPITKPLLIHALKHLPSLVNLDLTRTQATEEVIQAIKNDRLKCLKVAYCPHVTFCSLQRLATPCLVSLDIRGFKFLAAEAAATAMDVA